MARARLKECRDEYPLRGQILCTWTFFFAFCLPEEIHLGQSFNRIIGPDNVVFVEKRRCGGPIKRRPEAPLAIQP